MSDQAINNTDKERIKRAESNGWTGIIKVQYPNGDKFMRKPPIGRKWDGGYDVKEIPQ